MFVPDKKDFPILIHGKEGHGASFFRLNWLQSLSGRVTRLFFGARIQWQNKSLKKSWAIICPPVL